MSYADVDYKALIEIHNKPMIYWVLKAINDSNTASRIFITGIPKDKVILPEGLDSSIIEYFEITGDTVDKIVKGANHAIKRANEDESIFPSGRTHGIIINSDIPAIDKNSITHFLDNCGDRSASFYYSIVDQDGMDQRFPNNGRSFTKIDNKYYCGADLVLAELSLAEPSYPMIKKITENRKNFVKALFWASPLTFFKFIFNRVGLKDAERLMTKIFKLESRLIISKDPEIAFDVDKPSQLELMQKYFRPQKS